MSRKKNRELAEAGWIFRDGKRVRKEDWYAAHPSPAMKQERQRGVKAAVADTLKQKFGKIEGITDGDIAIVQNGEVLAAKDASVAIFEAIPNRYYCTACRKYHLKSSKIGFDHSRHYLAEV